MRKSIVISLLLALLIAVLPAVAEGLPEIHPQDPPATPAIEEHAAKGSAQLQLNGKNFDLVFDDDPQFTTVSDTTIQASFFVEQQDRLIEIYIIFPATVEAGSVITPQNSFEAQDEKSGLFMFDSLGDDTQCSLATQDNEGLFPEGSDYSISFLDVSRTGSLVTFDGAAYGTLAIVDDDYYETGAFNELIISFSFTIDTAADTAPSPDASPEATPEPELEPEVTEAPTIEPERYKI